MLPSLTLDSSGTATAAAASPATNVEEKEIPVEKLDIDRLSPNEQTAVREFAKQIDVRDTNQVLNYGSAAQKNIADFSGQALGKVRTKDLGEVGGMISGLVVELQASTQRRREKRHPWHL